MNIKDYNFKVGDTVITTRGEVGKITGICYCEHCAERGFFEPTWRVKTEEWDRYITTYDADNEFKYFYRIGEYRFNEFDKTAVLSEMDLHKKALKRLKKQLKVIKRSKERSKRC